MPRLKIVEEDEVEPVEGTLPGLGVDPGGTGKGGMPFEMPPGMEGVELPEEFDINNPVIQQLLQATQQQQQAGNAAEEQQPTSQLVEPKPGFCIKTQTDKHDKVFINVCHSELLPDPPKLSDQELAHAIATWDNSKYRIPMSIGEPHAELDVAKQGCTAYDAVMSTDAFNEIKVRAGMREFIIELVISQIEHKFKTLLDRDYNVLTKRRKYGTLEPHRIRTSKKKIAEMTGPGSSGGGDGADSTTETDIPAPTYTLQKEPAEGRPEFYVLEVELPTIRSSKALALDVGEDRLELSAHPRKFQLGLNFEWPLEAKETGAQFDKKRHVLTVTLTVAPERG